MHHVQQQALLALRVVLGEHDHNDLESLEWETLLPIACENAVLVRIADRVESTGGDLPASVRQAVREERDRVDRALSLARRLGENCHRHGIRYMLPKLVQHYPDMGRDLDLLVMDESLRVDRLVLDGLLVAAKPVSLRSRIARTTTHVVAPTGLEVDIHHGRLGPLAEHRRFPKDLLEQRRRVSVADSEFVVPCPEHQLVLQGVQKAWGRSSFRLAEVVHTHRAVRRGIDWARVLDVSAQLSVRHSVSCYLTYAEQVHRDAELGQLIPQSVWSRLKPGGWGRIRFRRARFRFPATWVHTRTYAAMVAHATTTADWRRLERLTVAPLVAIAEAAARSGAGRVTSGRPDRRGWHAEDSSAHAVGH